MRACLSRSRVLVAALLIGVAALAGCQRSDDFPSRPVMLICPWSPGGGTDRVARQVAVLLEQELGVPVNVINAVGGAGVTGHTRGALAPADGYTLTLITPELNMLHWRGFTNITYRQFDPLCVVNRDEAALFVRSDAPWSSLDELVDDIRRRPGGLKASGTAFGGIWHVCLVGWLEAVEIDPRSVPWISINGAAPSLQELVAGGIDLVCCSVPEAQTLLDAGKVRCLAVMGPARVASLPEVPTLAEQGIDLSLRGWRGVALPLAVPEQRREVLRQALDKVASSQALRAFLDSNGFNHTVLNSAEFSELLADDDRMYGEIFHGPAFAAGRRGWVGPYTFPLVLGGLLLLAGGLLVAREGLGPPVDGRPVGVRDLVPLAIVAGAVAAYCLLAETGGFVLTAGAMVAGLCLWLRVRWWVAVTLAVVLVPLVYTLFAVALRVPLPHGWLGW